MLFFENDHSISKRFITKRACSRIKEQVLFYYFMAGSSKRCRIVAFQATDASSILVPATMVGSSNWRG